MNSGGEFLFTYFFKAISLFILFSCSATSYSNEVPGGIIVHNQLGFYPEAKKIAVYKGETAVNEFKIHSAEDGKVVYTGKITDYRISPYSSEKTAVLNFTPFVQPGTYYIQIAGSLKSFDFEIKPTVHRELLRGALKSYYFQRMSVPLEEKYAGKWARAVGHPDTVIYIHSSAASAHLSEGSVLKAPYGWYDAGDYNKYIVNSGITMGTLLSLYEEFPDYFKSYKTNIPESENDIPDLLDELKFNLEWMLAMQDTSDGGVYHKLTTANFEGMVMPDKASAKRYVVQKSVTASLDFAAVMAQAARIFRNYQKELPNYSEKCLQAAEHAWQWAKENPEMLYNQSAMNQKYNPPINTGAYGDNNKDDEEAWAAAELWITTGNDKYYRAAEIISDEKFQVPSWGNVRALGYYSILRHKNNLPSEAVNIIEEKLTQYAEEVTSARSKNAFDVVMGLNESDFVWGSNAVAANQGMALLQAYKVSNKKDFLEAAIDNLDYLLGRNATGYSFVTGYGDKTPLYPHHRPSEADTVEAPVPGFLVGGPNPRQQDKCEYSSYFADESYVDHVCSYASNEIAINWNAPLVYLTGAIEIYKSE